MSILSKTSTTVLLSLKFLLVSTGVLMMAIALKFLAPAIVDFSVYVVPSIYNGVVSCLRPPYLYLLINFIIITIVASSKLQSTKDDVSPSEAIAPLQPQPVADKSIQADYPTAEYKYNEVVLSDSSSNYDLKEEKVLFGLDDAYRKLDATTSGTVNDTVAPFIASDGGANSDVPFVEDAMVSNKENKHVIGESTWNALGKEDSTENFPSTVKPPVSARLRHRRSNVKSSPEGGKTILGVSKPKKQDTLESTWKTITEGRGVPLTRHLRKSDTWERDNHAQSRRLRHPDKNPPRIMMTKAETFNDMTNTKNSPSLSPSPGSGKLRREASLSQDELNRRVEAFIKKFNEDMRLQRQESLNQYTEMIKRGSH